MTKHQLPSNPSLEICPSILSADFAHLADHVAQVEPQVNMLHLDVMDGHFVPNMTFGPVLVKWLRPCSKLFFDVHLMISDPATYAPQFIKAGADGITFHLETTTDPKAIISQLRNLNISVGVSIKPKTPVESLKSIIDLVDMVLLMTVEPGFGGQSFIMDSITRCEQLRAMLRPDQRLQVDGGIDHETTPLITRAGADTLVAGSYIFGAPNPIEAIQRIKKAAIKHP